MDARRSLDTSAPVGASGTDQPARTSGGERARSLGRPDLPCFAQLRRELILPGINTHFADELLD